MAIAKDLSIAYLIAYVTLFSLYIYEINSRKLYLLWLIKMATTIDINRISGELFILWTESFGIPFGDLDTHPITLSLWDSGIRDFYTDFTVMSTEDIKELKYIELDPDTNNLVEASLSTAHRRLICVVLSAWHHESRKIGAPLNLDKFTKDLVCLLYTSPSPRDGLLTRMPSSA